MFKRLVRDQKKANSRNTLTSGNLETYPTKGIELDTKIP